jgi:hypothetical protein
LARWSEVVESAPEFAARVRASFDSHKHKTLATLRKDGSPRVSGIEAEIDGGELWLGSMPGALKARDLQRDPRFALHGPPVLLNAGDPAPNSAPAPAEGDVKLSGYAVEATDWDEIASIMTARGLNPDDYSGSHFFKADIREIVLTRVEGSLLHIDLWRPAHGLRHFERA